jgi:hypothetical protein
MNETIKPPQLIEPHARYYMANVLHNCSQTRAKIYTNIINITVGVLFIGFTLIILYFCYKNRATPEEKYEKEIRDQAYILTKIRQYKDEMRNIESKKLITGLPLV